MSRFVETIGDFKRRWENRTKDGRSLALTAVAVGYFLFIGTQMIFPVLLPYLRSTYGLSLTVAGLLFTTIWTANALGTLPGGALADRIGGVPVLIGSMILSASALTVVVFSNSVVTLFAATGVFGIGLAMYGIARFPVTYELYPDHIGTVTGLVLAAADAGQTLLPPVAGIIAVALGWKLGLGFVIPLFFLVAAFMWWTAYVHVPDSIGERQTVSSGDIGYLFSELRQPPIIIGTGILIIYGIIWAAFTGFYPTYLIEIKGVSTTVSGFLFALFFGTGILVKPASGIAYDRFGSRYALLIAAAIPVSAFVMLPIAEGVWALAVVTVLAAPILGSATVVQPYILEILPEDLRGTGLGTVRTIFLFLTAGSPLVFGAIADRGFFDEMYYLLAVLAGLNVILAFRMPVVPSE